MLVTKFNSRYALGLGAEVCFGGAKVVSRHSIHQHTGYSYDLQMEVFPGKHTDINSLVHFLSVSPVPRT